MITMTSQRARKLESQPQQSLAQHFPELHFSTYIARDARSAQAFEVRTSDLGGAVFDRSGRYRYLLWRNLNGTSFPPSAAGRKLLLVMLNPNKADETRNDPTIRRCIGFAQSWGYSRLEVVNLFAVCAEKPSMLRSFERPIGSYNDAVIIASAKTADSIVVAWGNHGSVLNRDSDVLSCLKSYGPVGCLGITKSGMPRHPLYVRADARLLPFYSN